MGAIEWVDGEYSSAFVFRAFRLEVWCQERSGKAEWGWEVILAGERHSSVLRRAKHPLYFRDDAKKECLEAARELIGPAADALGVGWKDGAEAMREKVEEAIDRRAIGAHLDNDYEKQGIFSEASDIITSLPLPEVPRD